MLEHTKDFNGLINLATAVPKKFNTKPKDWTDNNKLRIDAVKILVSVAKANKIPFFLQGTSLLSYGHRKGAWVDETVRLKHPPDTYYDLSDDYLDILDSTIRCEYILNHIFDGLLPRIILRFGMIYGPNTFHTQELIEQVQKNVFPIIDKGTSYLNLIHVDDAASAVVHAVTHYKKIRKETFNISDDLPVTNADLINYLTKKLHAKGPKLVAPKIGDMLLSKFTTNILLSSFRSKNKKFKEMTGWNPKYKSYKEGFEEILAEKE